MAERIIELRGLSKSFPVRGRGLRRSTSLVHAVRDVNLDVFEGETLGIVGESGCGKTTLSRMLVRLIRPTSGEYLYRGLPVHELRGVELKNFRSKVQMVFQDPFSSLDPREKVGDSIAEPLIHNRSLNREERKARVEEMLELVGLDRKSYFKLPHEFSGGQRQRIGIARALILEPEVLIADEPVSALDVSVQAQILNLLKDLQERLGLTVVFVGHNLSVIENVADRVAVMYLGSVVEVAARDQLFDAPEHPYTETLLAAVPAKHPSMRRKDAMPRGEIPSPIDPPPGCRFHPRCPIAQDGLCDVIEPPLLADSDLRAVACHVRNRERNVPQPN